MKHVSLPAVYDDDLAEYLNNLGLLSDLQAGLLRCKFCEDTVTLDTLHALLPDSGTISLVCSRVTCIKHLLRFLSEK